MKIGITCYPTYGGSGVVASELGKSLAERGHEIHFISSSLPNRIFQLTERIRFHEVEVMDYPLFEHTPYCLALATKMAEVADKENLDLLHVHYAIPHSISAYLAREMLVDKRRLPIATTLHGTDITLVGRNHSYLPITRFAIRQSDGVTAVSRYLKAATQREFCCDCEIEVIPNFINGKTFQRRFSQQLYRRFAPKGERILVHLSNFRPIKKVGDVVKIFARVQKQMPAVLLFLGDGVERSNVEFMVWELGLSEKVFFMGKVNEPADYLSISDLMILPSELESFGLAALEAMACEVPVIATRVGGLPELLQAGETGCLAPVGAIDEMARCAVELLSDENHLRQLGSNARQRALTSYDCDKIVPRYEAFYQKLIEGKPAGKED
ncbi:MAG: N-acetyl-alpha-D-glucosaminyl L-malate synthase BshA [Acidobacteria bacterium]|nr:N-acetyl-alpha-D-glucosaminyl L-malate synthase BshA [Acidobacteriota bacterium]